jgi:triacylglycerol lipase
MQIREHKAPLTTLSSQKASKPASAPVYEIVKTLPSDTWQETEVIRDRDEIFVQRDFHPRTKHRDERVIKAFGTDAPHSGDALLHFAGPPKGDQRKTPVLLVHGANKNGHFFWDPKEDGSDKGLAQRLTDDGHPTYAVTFAHNQDDNFIWAEQIANAIAEIKKDTGSDKVDLVAHSKGGVAARIYTSDVRKEGVESTPYQNDVRRLVLVGSPNKGVDYSFRHPSINYTLAKSSDHPMLNAPVSWEKMGAFPFFQDISDKGFGGEEPDYFPGQRQILANLSEDYPLSVVEPDWYTTYHGGVGFNSTSRGIDFFVEQGENVIARLNDNPPNSDIEVAVLAGNRANIPGILNEYTGPSDGLVFVDSALEMPEGTNLVAQDVLPLHHKALISDKKGQDWITQALDEKAPEIEVDASTILMRAKKEWTPEAVQQEAIAQVKTLSHLKAQPDLAENIIFPMV